MDQERYAVLLLDVKKFLELPAVRQEFFGQFEPDGTLYRKACEAVTELERMAVMPAPLVR